MEVKYSTTNNEINIIEALNKQLKRQENLVVCFDSLFLLSPQCSYLSSERVRGRVVGG